MAVAAAGRGGLACSSRGSLAVCAPPCSFRMETGNLVEVEEAAPPWQDLMEGRKLPMLLQDPSGKVWQEALQDQRRAPLPAGVRWTQGQGERRTLSSLRIYECSFLCSAE